MSPNHLQVKLTLCLNESDPFYRWIPKIYEGKLFSSCHKTVQMWALHNAIRPSEANYSIPYQLLQNLPGDFHARTRGRWGPAKVSS